MTVCKKLILKKLLGVQKMDITDYKLLKWKCIKGKYLYLLETPLKHYAVVLHDTDDFTVLKSQFELDYVDGLHTYNKWKEDLLISL